MISPPADFQVALVDLSKEGLGTELARLSHEESLRPFDLTRGPLFRASLVRLAAREHTLLVTLHHIIADGWSMGILLRELATLYGAFSRGAPSPLPELPVQYADFAVWQRQWLQGERLAAELDVWRRRLDGIPEVLELPYDHPRPAVESFRGSTLSFALPPVRVRELAALARRHGATLSMTMLAGFQVLLARSTGREDVPVGVAIANRTRREIEDLIGFFVNTLVVRGDLAGSPGFARLLARVRETALEAYAHQDLPFERLVEELQPARNPSRNPLIQVMFAFQNFPRVETEVRGLVLSSPRDGQAPVQTAKFDLSLFLAEEGGPARRGARVQPRPVRSGDPAAPAGPLREPAGRGRDATRDAGGSPAAPDRRGEPSAPAGSECRRLGRPLRDEPAGAVRGPGPQGPRRARAALRRERPLPTRS